MDAQNLHGRTEFAWMHGISMDAQNLHRRSTEIGQSGRGSQWRVCHQRGLPRLVLDEAVYPSITRKTRKWPGMLKKVF